MFVCIVCDLLGALSYYCCNINKFYVVFCVCSKTFRLQFTFTCKTVVKIWISRAGLFCCIATHDLTQCIRMEKWNDKYSEFMSLESITIVNSFTLFLLLFVMRKLNRKGRILCCALPDKDIHVYSSSSLNCQFQERPSLMRS